MKNITILLVFCSLFLLAWCQEVPRNTSAIDEQRKTELNQRNLNELQPAPSISWSLERDNLIKRFKMMNDRSISFYMYVFIEWVADPIGYYQVNKVSSVNSQLTNPEQVVDPCPQSYCPQILPSPAEDWSYGSNGDGVFGFTPEWIYIEHNMKYIVSLTPLSFNKKVPMLAVLNVNDKKSLENILSKIK